MGLALEQARKAKGRTLPNPAVGAVVVKEGAVVGSGKTAPVGGPHAEVCALRRAGDAARGATLYVTLEPCCHYGRTPPCTDAIIAAGISRVCYSVKDPNPLVAGKGAARLRAAGIQVRFGLGRDEAVRINEDFFWNISQNLPWVSLKLALTLDGRIADARGSSQWITSPLARREVHRLRREHAGIAVGRGTLLADNPRLTVRHLGGRSPARFVFSSTARIPAGLHFVQGAGEVRSVIVLPGGEAGRRRTGKNGVELWHTGASSPAEGLRTFLQMAYEEGMSSLLVEGGQGLATSFLQNQLVNRIYYFFGNKILGNGLSGLAFSPAPALHSCITLQKTEFLPLGDNLMVTGLPQWHEE
jgi:diaminohydroxyphosphoribosylaminopyrimidine deaminase/5-amino-6-(5-phosphoribosylamino)uracil reductase